MTFRCFDGNYSSSMLVLNAGVSRAHIGCMASVTNILSCRFERNFALQYEGGDFLHMLRCNRAVFEGICDKLRPLWRKQDTNIVFPFCGEKGAA